MNLYHISYISSFLLLSTKQSLIRLPPFITQKRVEQFSPSLNCFICLSSELQNNPKTYERGLDTYAYKTAAQNDS